MKQPHRASSYPLFAVLTAALLANSGIAALAQEDPPDYPQFDSAGMEPVAVVRVADPTTVVLSMDGEERAVELIGVRSAPTRELREAAKAALTRMLAGETVYVVVEVDADPQEAGGSDRAYLYRAPDGLLVNLELVRQGYAKTGSRPTFTHQRLFRYHERVAREHQKGVWSERVATVGDEVEPQSSAADAAGETIVYLTRTGKKYHRKDCQFAQKTGRPVSLKEAAEHHDPCSVCDPPELPKP